MKVNDTYPIMYRIALPPVTRIMQFKKSIVPSLKNPALKFAYEFKVNISKLEIGFP